MTECLSEQESIRKQETRSVRCSVLQCKKGFRMEADIARLKQDLKVDREIRKVLKKINSKEGQSRRRSISVPNGSSPPVIRLMKQSIRKCS